ncbi:arginine metabolism regulation protein II [Exophiala xenobiotica]|nr:arginine metabolism regulation protein II [Exophiala xenobiotica]KAK5354603.1 arginine metabolism regulation protein II [Exophiala xenobiotica]KAK5381816.1 arginine metabolism regulation protein II [Exophiala xenobiotica]KAK5382594.1 arginine metabolism regulation protein II [Exophiala xenobiotica]
MPQPRSQRQRTRTLTGCYTCRERKIKCDDGRPACKRCTALGVACQGYGVKLSWLAYDPGCSQTKQAGTEPGQPSKLAKGKENGTYEPTIRRRPLFTERERVGMISEIQRTFLNGNQDGNIDRAIDKIDALAEELDGHSQPGQDTGPFGFFVLDSSARSEVTHHEDVTTPDAANGETESSPEPVHGDLFQMDNSHALGLDEPPMPWLIGMDEMTLPWLDGANDSLGPTLTDELLHQGPHVSGQPGTDNYSDGRFAAYEFDQASAAVHGFLTPSFSWQPMFAVGTRTEGVFFDTAEQSHCTGYSSLNRIPRSLSNMENISRIPSEARFLLEHYSTEVVSFMCHLPNPQSPWRTIHFPCAMSTMADLLVFGSTNNARMALFYALLSISANHLGSKIPWSVRLEKRSQDAARESESNSLLDTNDPREMSNYWLAKGSLFQDMATSQIQTCLQIQQGNRDDQEDYRELLMSLLSMVTISVTSGKLNSAHLYLKRAKKLIEIFVARSHDSSFKSSKIAALHQIYSYLQIIYNSTNVSRTVGGSESEHYSLVQHLHEGDTGSFPAIVVGPLLPPTLESSLDSLAQHRDDYQLFGKIYGVPRSLLTLISRASALAKELEEEEGSPNSSSPSSCNFRPRCQVLEDQICNWQPIDDELSPVQPSSTYDPQVGSHLVQAMHDALIVMFFRRVRPINPAVLQHYVESAADHLNEQEAVKGRTGINAPALLWPWFMVASEAIKETIRDKLRLWSSLARQYGGRNLEIAEQVVTEVWRRHDLELPNPTWVDVVREWGVTLVLT